MKNFLYEICGDEELGNLIGKLLQLIGFIIGTFLASGLTWLLGYDGFFAFILTIIFAHISLEVCNWVTPGPRINLMIFFFLYMGILGSIAIYHTDKIYTGRDPFFVVEEKIDMPEAHEKIKSNDRTGVFRFLAIEAQGFWVGLIVAWCLMLYRIPGILDNKMEKIEAIWLSIGTFCGLLFSSFYFSYNLIGNLYTILNCGWISGICFGGVAMMIMESIKNK